MSDKVVYSFYLENAGAAVIGAIPAFVSFINLTNSANQGGDGDKELPLGSRPPIEELNDGFYYFEFDWNTQGGSASSYLVKINNDSTNEGLFQNPEQKFLIMRLDRNDNLSNMVNSIKTSSSEITTATSALLKSVNRLLEVEQGTWKIELEGGLYYLNLYPTKSINNESLYESGLDVNIPFAKYLLQDQDGATTPTNPFRRVQDAIAALPNGE